jgi:hypothetical protein
MTDDAFLIEDRLDLAIKVDFPLSGGDNGNSRQAHHQASNRQPYFIVPEPGHMYLIK